MREILVTVLIDCFNQGDFITDAIRSVLAQDFPGEQMEILVVDDGSTDDTPERVAKFGGDVRYCYKPNGGQASALNFGFQQARGKVIAFLDGDDVWLPGKLSRVAEEFQRDPQLAMVYHNYCFWNSQTDQTTSGFFTEVSGAIPGDLRKLLSYSISPTSAIAFSREALDRLMPIPAALAIQADAYLVGLAIFLGKVKAIPECLNRNRVHGQNLWFSEGENIDRSVLERRIATRQALIEGMQAWLRENGWALPDPEIRAYFKQWQLLQESDIFKLNPPGRTRLFSYLAEFPKTYASVMTRRHLAYSWFTAFAALILGHKHLDKVESVRPQARRLAQYFRGATN